jgi:dienelactone hydrolase
MRARRLSTALLTTLLALLPTGAWAHSPVPEATPGASPAAIRLEAAIDDRDARSRVEVIPDANHLFQHATTGSPAEYPTLEQAFTPESLPMLTDWVRHVTGLDG